MSRASDEGGRADWAFTLAVTLVALAPRLFVAIAWAREPVWDGHYYHFGAMRIAEGLGYSEDVVIAGREVWKPWCHYPVGYSAMLAGLYVIFGNGILVAPVANALIGALTVLFVHRLACFGLSTNRARVAAGIAALHPGLIAFSGVAMSEPLNALLVALAGWLALRWRGKPAGVLSAGLTLGLATLVRPSSLLAAPLLALVWPKPRIRAIGAGVAATALAIVVCVPWTVRNCHVMDGCAFVSTNGGWNLAIGALTETGRFRTLRAEDGCPIVTGQVQQDRCWAAVGRREIARAPGQWLGLVPKKLGHLWDHESFAIEYLREADPDTWPEARREAGRHLLTGFHRLLLVVAALSVIGLPNPQRRRTGDLVQGALALLVLGWGAYAFSSVEHPFFWLPGLLPLVALLPLPGRPSLGAVGRYAAGLVAVTSVTHAIFFGEDRYHLVVTPMLCILAAAALRRPRSAAEALAGPAEQT